MFTIGDFASYGRVSVRMLRHYDALGLLQPAYTDRLTGYRWYEARQLSRLNRIVALKDLGFTLEQVGSILDDKVSAEELRGMLRLRRAELQGQVTAGIARLAQVEARLQVIEREGAMPTDDVQVKRIPVGPSIAYYEDAADGDGVLVHAAVPVSADPGGGHGFSIVDLPEIEHAATIVHHGSMDNVVPTIQTMARWIEANGYRSAGYNRELYIELGADRDTWVTELQEPIELTRGPVK